MKLGGLAAVEERLVGVQEIEAKLEGLGKRAELYQVSQVIVCCADQTSSWEVMTWHVPQLQQ